MVNLANVKHRPVFATINIGFSTFYSCFVIVIFSTFYSALPLLSALPKYGLFQGLEISQAHAIQRGSSRKDRIFKTLFTVCHILIFKRCFKYPYYY